MMSGGVIADTDITPVLEVDSLTVQYRSQGVKFFAVRDVSLRLARGETLGIVGESGCGKSSLVRGICQLVDSNASRIGLGDDDLLSASTQQRRQMVRRMPIVFQDPISSLNPRRTVRQIVEQPLVIGRVDRAARLERVCAAIELVGLGPEHLSRRPHELSGGQCQRVSIARALVSDPTLLICDESVSALDVSVQAQVLNLLADLKAERGLAMLFVSHDLLVVKVISDRVLVMYLGAVVESAPTDVIFSRPVHPYTKALLAAVPGHHSTSVGEISGEIPSPINPPPGCGYSSRCPYATELCSTPPPVVEVDDQHSVACHFASDFAAARR